MKYIWEASDIATANLVLVTRDDNVIAIATRDSVVDVRDGFRIRANCESKEIAEFLTEGGWRPVTKPMSVTECVREAMKHYDY